MLLVGILLVTFSPLIAAATQGNPGKILTKLTFVISPAAILPGDLEDTLDVVVSGNSSGNSFGHFYGYNDNSVTTMASAVKSGLHCLSMEQGDGCDNVVCCPGLVPIIPAVPVHPIIETHNMHVSNSQYNVTLPADIKPPIASFD